MNFVEKNEFEALLFDLLNPLKTHYSEDCARLNVGSTAAGYSVDVSRMEAFARPLWGLGVILARRRTKRGI